MHYEKIKLINEIYSDEYIKSLSIEELDKLKEEINNISTKIYDSKSKKEEEQFNLNFNGKYLKIEHKFKGTHYIHVQNQWHSIRGNYGHLYLEGQTIKGNFHPIYRDCTYFQYDQWNQLEIPINDIEESITEITKKDFIDKFYEMTLQMKTEFTEIESKGNKKDLYNNEEN